MAISTIMYKQLDVSKVTLQYNVKTEKGIVLFKVLYDNRPLFIQTPRMHAPFGITKDSQSGRYSLTLAFKNEEHSQGLKIFRQKLEDLDDRIRQLWVEEYPEYLPVNPLKETDTVRTQILLSDAYSSSIKESKPRDDKKKYPDNFRVVIVVDENGDPRPSFYNINEEKQKIEDVFPNAEICNIVSVTAFYSSGLKKYGPIYKMYQCQFKNSSSLKGFQIMNDEDGDEDEDEEEV